MLPVRFTNILRRDSHRLNDAGRLSEAAAVVAT
jgi:hypothetical protein